MRAKIVGRRMRTRRGSWVHWYASLKDANGVVVWRDDCRDLGKLVDSARERAGAFSVVAALGQTFRPWSEIVDEAVI